MILLRRVEDTLKEMLKEKWKAAELISYRRPHEDDKSARKS
jgi:hypothetical protein